MKKMILWTLALFTPLLWTTTAHALFGIPDVAALAQRVTIIANQGVQIANSVTQITRITEQFNKLKEQYDHLHAATLGQVAALTDPFSTLAAIPGQLVGTGLAWRSDFTNPAAADLVTALDLFSNSGTPLTDHFRGRLSNTPTVTEADVIAEYSTLPVSLATRAAENYRRQRDEGEQRTALNYDVSDAAANATTIVKSAIDSYAQLRGQTNTGDTALRQAQVTGLITNGEVSAQLLQLQAHEAAQNAAQELAVEQRRRERETARLATLRAGRVDHERRLIGINAHRDGGLSLLSSVK